MATRGGHVAVVGSINLDLVSRVPRLPSPGETVVATEHRQSLGGKGANQAVAAARAGAAVTMVGCVGDDSGGRALLHELGRHGVDVGLVAFAPTSTGSASIAVDDEGENLIVVNRGANDLVVLDPAAIERELSSEPSLWLAQGELTSAVTDAIAQLAKGRGERLVLNLAPFLAVDAGTLRYADPLVVNEREALDVCEHLDLEGSAQVRTSLDNTQRISLDAAQGLTLELAAALQTGVVVTLGSNGAVGCESGAVWHQPAPSVAAVVETTGAGDALCGVLAAYLAQGHPLRDSLRVAVHAASFAVTRAGTVEAYPDADRLQAMFEADRP